MTDLPNLTRLAVGELFDPEITSYMHLAAQGVNLALSNEGCILFGYYADPRPDEIAAWNGRMGDAKFGWVDAGATAFLVAQLGRGAPYIDTSYHPGHLPPEIRGLPRGDQQPQLDTIDYLARTPLDMSDDGNDLVIVGATDSKVRGHFGEKGGHLLVSLILINARNGRIAAMRQLTWPPRFVYAVRATVERLMAEGLDLKAEREAVERMYRFTARDLYQTMSAMRCVGGEPE